MSESALFTAIVEGDFSSAQAEAEQMLLAKADAQEILEKHLIPAMNEVGRLFDEGDYFVPELLLASRAMQEVMKRLDPLLKSSGVEKVGRVIIGTVAGDMHDIGKNLVASMLEGGGFEVTDLGVNVAPEKFLGAVKAAGDKTVLALSALLTTTMPQMKKVLELLEAEGLREQVKVMIGGAPVSEAFAAEIGADGYSDSANSAVTLARRLAS